jgi:hypothetical protein
MAKHALVLVVAMAAVLAVTPAVAGEVTGLTTFTPGTPALAAEVNGNFGAVANAVNDNHSRLTAAEADIDTRQERVDGTCADGTAMTAVDADGDVTCTPLLPDGKVSISSHAFVRAAYNGAANCVLNHFFPETYLTGAAGTSGCILAAPISLPDGATLTSASCGVRDSYAPGEFNITLYRASLEGDTDSVFLLPTSTDGAEQVLTDATPEAGLAVVDNDYIYYFMAIVGSGGNAFDTITFNLSMIGCSVAYAGS